MHVSSLGSIAGIISRETLYPLLHPFVPSPVAVGLHSFTLRQRSRMAAHEALASSNRVRDAAAALEQGDQGSRSRDRRELEGKESKRQRGEEQPESSDDELAAALVRIKGEIVSEINASTKTLLDDKLDSTANALKKYTDKKCEKIDGQFKDVRKELDNLADRQNKTDTDHKQMWAALNQMQSALALAETPNHEPPAGAASAASSHEVVDKTILRTNTTNLVGYDELLAELKKVCDDADVSSDKYELKGGQLAKRFTLAFKGDANLASRRAHKVRTSLRKSEADGTTKWTDVFVQPPSGEPEKVYISPDKKKSEERREQGTKLLVALLKESKIWDKHFSHVKKEFSVTWDWKPVATIEYNHESRECHIKWLAAASQTSIDTGSIDEKYATRCAEKKHRG